MNVGGDKRRFKKGIAKQRPRKAPANYQKDNQAVKRYAALDFSIANMRRTNFLAAGERAIL